MNKNFLSVKKAEKLYGKMPPVIPEVLAVKPGEELEEEFIKADVEIRKRVDRLAKEGAKDE